MPLAVNIEIRGNTIKVEMLSFDAISGKHWNSEGDKIKIELLPLMLLVVNIEIEGALN